MRRRCLIAIVLAASAVGAGCDGCSKSSEKTKPERARASADECRSAADCADENPCTEASCNDGRCTKSFVAEGTNCDNGTVCDGISRCDGRGRCAPGVPALVDDGNACTTDSCDPIEGARHEPLPIDDFDVCTKDACDPRTGVVSHEPVELDDGDDCTFDSCDPKTGAKHDRPNAFHTCDASCGAGFHAASRTPSRECATKLRSFCVPDCGASFYSCEQACPNGYHATSRNTGSSSCDGAAQTFCEKNAGESFYSCDASCPSGYQKQSESATRQCGTGSTRRLLCTRAP